jgi:DNA-damage-inducible protein D
LPIYSEYRKQKKSIQQIEQEQMTRLKAKAKKGKILLDE